MLCEDVRRGDEEHLGQVERHAEVVVREAVVLRRIEHLEERGGGVALERHAELVHLVEEEDGVLRAGLLHPLDDAPGQRADVRAPVAADVRLVARAAERDAHVLASHRAGDGLRDRRLPGAGRADEEQDRAVLQDPVVVLAARLRAGRRLRRRSALPLPQLADRQELEDPLLHVLEAVVVLFQHLVGARRIEQVLRARVPRQLGDPLQEGADDLRLHRFLGCPLQAVELALDLLLRGFGEVQLLQLLAQPRDVVILVPVAELAADGLELLAQVHLALPLPDLLLHLRLDVLLRVGDGDLALHLHQDAPEPVLHGQRLQQGLPLRRLQVEVPCHEVGEASGVADRREDLLDHLLRQAALLRQLRGALARFLVQRLEGRVERVERRQIGILAQDGLEVSLVLADMDRVARYSPCRTSWTPPSPRWIWPMRATVPMVCRFSADACSTFSRWASARISRLSSFSAVSIARRVPGRPALIGEVMPGNSTMSRSGRTGSVTRSVIGRSRRAGTLMEQGTTPDKHPSCHPGGGNLRHTGRNARRRSCPVALRPLIYGAMRSSAS